MNNNLFNDAIFVYDYCHRKFISFQHEPKLFQIRTVLAGELKIRCKHETLTVHAGEACYLPQEIEAQLEAGKGRNCYGKVLKFRYFPGVDITDYKPQVFKLSKKNLEILAAFPKIEKNVDSENVWRFYRLLDCLTEDMCKNETEQAFKMKKALLFMRKQNVYTVAEVAAYCGMSERLFYDVFKKTCFITPTQMKQKLQAVKAEELLKNTNLSVKEIAVQVGYYSETYFRKVMQKRYGKTPKKIRT